MNDVWQFLSDAATFFANLWSWVVYGAGVVRDSEAAKKLASVQWTDVTWSIQWIYSNITSVAVLISSCLTIYGVTRYLRRTNTFLVEKKYDALHQIRSFATGLHSEVNIAHNEENIEEARRMLMKSFYSHKYLFGADLAAVMHKQWSSINRSTHDFIKLSRNSNTDEGSLSSPAKNTSTVSKERANLTIAIIAFTAMLAKNAEVYVKELDTSRRLPN